MRDDFEEIYLHARRLGLRVMIFTNATLVTPRLARLLRDVPPLEAVEVSVYGMKAETYEAVTRTPGSFDAFRRGLGLLRDHGVPFIVKGAVLPADARGDGRIRGLGGRPPRRPGVRPIALLFDLRSRRDGRKNELIAEPAGSDADEFVRIARRHGEAGRRGVAGFLRPLRRRPRRPPVHVPAVGGVGRGRPLRAAPILPRPAASGHDLRPREGLAPRGGDGFPAARPGHALGRPRPTSNAAAGVFSRASASSARPSPGPSTGPWTRRSNISAASPTPRPSPPAFSSRGRRPGPSSTDGTARTGETEELIHERRRSTSARSTGRPRTSWSGRSRARSSSSRSSPGSATWRTSSSPSTRPAATSGRGSTGRRRWPRSSGSWPRSTTPRTGSSKATSSGSSRSSSSGG